MAAGLLAALAVSAAAQALPDYRGTLASAETVVAACAAGAAGCNPAHAPADQLPSPRDADAPALRLDWLRAELTDAAQAPADQRARAMQQAQARLSRSLAALDAPPVDDRRARALSMTILQERQFHLAAQRPGWWQLLKARFWRWVDDMLESTAEAAEHRPWIGVALEWLVLAGALTGVTAYLLRLARRDRLRLEIAWRGQRRADAGSADRDWTAEAAEAAGRGAWRDAVHALYWGAIARLTAAGRWRAGEARTPREYLRLLAAGSADHPPLAMLTTLLEQAWYAGRPATESDYRSAEAQARALGVPVGTPARPGERH